MSKRRSIDYRSIVGDELPPEYYERALDELMQDENEQRDFVHSEFMPTDVIRQVLAGTISQDNAVLFLRLSFRCWLREHRKFRVTTMAWALYAADHPTQRRQ